MRDCRLSITGVAAEPHALAPTLRFAVRMETDAATLVHGAALRCRIHIEPQRRRYVDVEGDRLQEIFGTPEQWRDTVRSFFWTEASLLVPRFQGTVDVALSVASTCDLHVAAGQYCLALEDGEIPLVFLFSGSMFCAHGAGVHVIPIAWDVEARYLLPVQLWRELMARYFPEGAWIRLERRNLDALRAFQTRHCLATADLALAHLFQHLMPGDAA